MRTRVKHDRIVEIDALRGTAMLLVCVAHFFTVYFPPKGIPWVVLMQRSFMVASPTFILVSGLMLGFLYKSQLPEFASIRLKLVDRAVFLITVGHILIMIARAALPGGFNTAIHRVFITDAIGFSIIAGSFLITRTSTQTRFLLSVMLYVASWIMTLFFHPSFTLLRGIHDALFGTFMDEGPYLVGFYLVPWFSFYLLGSCLGEVLSDKMNSRRRLAAWILRTALVFTGLAVAIKGAYMFLHRFGVIPHSEWAYSLTSLFQKYPPGPVYFLFYGGIGMFVLFLLLQFGRVRIAKSYVSWASVLGRTSLITFIIQYYVYWVFLSSVHLYTRFWLFPLLGSVVFIYVLSYLWLRKDLNGFLTVGLYKGYAAHAAGHKYLR